MTSPNCLRSLLVGICAALLLSFTACQTTPSPKPHPTPIAAPVTPTAKPFDEARLREIDAAINHAIEAHQLPGGVFWLEHNGLIYRKAYGNRAVVPEVETATEDTIYDAASLTKVIATTSAVMLLIERGKVGLDDPVVKYIPEFGTNGKEVITVRQLLTHTSGLRPDISLTPAWQGYAQGIALVCAEKLRNPPGTTFVYSDINFITLGEIVHRTSGLMLNEFCTREVLAPLKMNDSGFLPPASKRIRIAPTEVVDGVPFRGVVHDPTARHMDGVAGHAGLFFTAADLARFARMMLNQGELDGVRIFKPETVRLMTSIQSPDNITAKRGLGWDIDSPYAGLRGSVFPVGSYGHTGWTGTSLWIDPYSHSFWMLLSNRNHPDEKGNVVGLRRVLGTLSGQAITDFDFSKYYPSVNAQTNAGPVLNGIDVLVREKFAPLKGLRIGLITNHTGHDQQRNPTIDLLHTAPGVSLRVLFSPEHGIRGEFDEKVADSADEKTGLPVFSLYGETRAPKSEQLKDLDALVYDIQDIGCRFYTYPATLGNCLEAAGKAGLKFFVLDRVNPINGVEIDGPVLAAKPSFVAFHTVPVRHGMTLGEVARMMNAERGYHAKLTVIPVEGWKRDEWFDQTGLPWTNPSPNMRSLTEAILYPGVGLLETTSVSVGRGTGTPFEVVGAPYINDVVLAAELNRANLPGVRFVPVRFTPTASVHRGKLCGGVNIILTDREHCHVVDIGMTIAAALYRLYPRDFDLDKFDRLLGHPATIEAIKAGKSLSDLHQLWAADVAKFKERRASYLLYP